MRLLLLTLSVVALAGCRASPSDRGPALGLDDLPLAPDTPPAWAAEAAWYEIDVDRFRNGDPDNDPTPAAVAATDAVSPMALLDAGWQPTPWADDWTARADWERDLGNAEVTLPLRRYGGDLQGVLDELPAIAALGVTALVLRVADVRAPHHVDPFLGPKPARDREAILLETPGDPATWGTSAADGLLQDLVEAAHARRLRVVLDVAWPGSLAATAADPDSAEVNALAIAVRWLDPDGDGDSSDGVDGFRLGADAGSAAFRVELRRVVKAIHPEAILIGRPASLAPTVGALDALADDRAFRVLQLGLDPLGPQITPAEVAAALGAVYAATPPDHLPAFLSTAGPADAPRLATALRNAGVPDAQASPRIRSGYDASRPGPDVMRAVALYRLLQATLPGAPHVLAGDEIGVWGARAPDNRRPMPWPDLVPSLPGSATRTPVPDAALRALTSEALRLRRDHPDLFARGTLAWEPEGDLLRFVRRSEREEAVVVVNLGTEAARVAVDATTLALHVGVPPGAIGGEVVLAPRSGAVFVRSLGS